MKKSKKVLAILLSTILFMSIAIPAFSDDAKVVKEVHLTMTEPVVNGSVPTDLTSAEPDKYTVEVNYWLNTFKSEEKVTVFEAGESYGVVYFVHAVNGYKFEEVGKINGHDFNNSPTVVYINDKVAHCVGVESETRLYRANIYEISEAVPEKQDGFFAKIWKSIKNFFKKIGDFFKNLFGIK